MEEEGRTGPSWKVSTNQVDHVVKAGRTDPGRKVSMNRVSIGEDRKDGSQSEGKYGLSIIWQRKDRV